MAPLIFTAMPPRAGGRFHLISATQQKFRIRIQVGLRPREMDTDCSLCSDWSTGTWAAFSLVETRDGEQRRMRQNKLKSRPIWCPPRYPVSADLNFMRIWDFWDSISEWKLNSWMKLSQVTQLLGPKVHTMSKLWLGNVWPKCYDM